MKTKTVIAVAVIAVLGGAVALICTKKPTSPQVAIPTKVTVPVVPTPRVVKKAPAGAPSETAVADWTRKFRASDDYLTFVKEALPAAQAGDGRAAWHVADALAVCALTMRNYKGVADPEAKLQQELQGMAKADQWVRDNDERITRRCMGLAREDIPGLQSAKYWRKAALEDGDPLAQVDAARTALASIQSNTSDEDKAAALKVARDNLRQVVESGDLEALWRTGHLLATPSYSTDSLQGMALALATCNLGRDCSAANPANASYMCKYSGACPPDADYAYFLQQSLGPDQYGALYARAQQIEAEVKANDSNALLANLMK